MNNQIVNLQDYILESGLFKTVEIDDLLIVEYRCLIDEQESDIWTHTNYIAYVLGGEKKWKTPSCEYKVGSGEALFIKKGANTVYQYFDEPFFVLFIFVPDEFIRNILWKYPELAMSSSPETRETQLIKLSLNKVMDSFFQSLMAHFSKEATLSKSILKLKIEELVLNILTQPNNQQLKHYFVSLGRKRKVDIKEIMNTHFFHPLSLEDFARLSARSLSTFRRDFKETFRQSPGKWLLTKRLEYGRFLLETTSQQINEIIENCGFKNRSHFIKSFKETYSVSPHQYRKNKSEILL